MELLAGRGGEGRGGWEVRSGGAGVYEKFTAFASKARDVFTKGKSADYSVEEQMTDVAHDDDAPLVQNYSKFQ